MAGRCERGGHRFGRDWTTRKLEVLAKYLTDYTTALKEFVGTGYPDTRRTDATARGLVFPDLAEQEL